MKLLCTLSIVIASIIGAQAVDYVFVNTTGTVPTARYWASCVYWNNSLVVAGGDIDTTANANGLYQKDIHFLDLNTQIWTTGTNNAYPFVNTNLATLVINNVAYFWGGSTNGNPVGSTGNRLAVFTTYNFDTGVWGQAPAVAAAPFSTFPRSLSSAVITPTGTIAIFGGSQGVGTFFNDFYEFNIASQNWTNLNPNNDTNIPSVRSGHSVTVYKGKMYVFGGRINAAVYNDLHAYDFTTNLWSVITTTGTIPAARFGGSGVLASDGTWIIYGGASASGTTQFADTSYLDLNTFIWSTPTVGVSPGQRYYHCAVQNGNTFYVYGGGNNTKTFGDIFSFTYVPPVQPTSAATSATVTGGTQGTSATATSAVTASTTIASSSVPNDGTKLGVVLGLAVFALALIF